MPKVAKELSALAVRRLSKPGLHAVGGVAGLLLRISDTGAKYWVLRATIGGKRRDVGLGPYPEIGLAEAREQAAEMRHQARNGTDPIAERNEKREALRAANAKALTFDQAADRYLKGKASEFRNAKHAKQWRATLDTYASPVLGKMAVDRVELAHVLQVLEPIWHTKTETASRVRGRVEKVLDYATVSGFREGENPARWRGNLDAILPAPAKLKKVQHHRAVPWQDMPAFMEALRKRQALAARALEFLVLTAARSGEVRGATWDEIDLQAKTWTVPAERMKASREHVVPLPDDAVALLEALPRFEGTPYVFPATKGGQLSDMALSALMRRMEVDATPHGFRSTFRDWVSETTAYPHEVAEMALAHTIPSAVERAYRRGDLLAKRSRLMTEWAAFLRDGAPAGGVVPLKGKTAEGQA
ncbi:tyrosine-type recombinase/integrase [Ectothiorhodospira shaposhnikovii]|uniref:tyrosine-type recombinase/integrase n=1 Tax=Ectothiorhodospira shaposhnikovii TaxID=1054 RepID=UPI001EE7F04C|nr:site-specific integrase [Ectothiorhodospira shaposhnikovii]MCG5513640.1 tyrosine-type recombinase/integrase [Ectothiorhodospira shaposhnikovii]